MRFCLDFSVGSRRDWRQHAAPQLVAAQTHACAASVMSELQDAVLEPIPSATKFTIGSLSNLDFSGGSRRDWRQHAAPQLVAAQTHACAASVMSEPQDAVLEPIPSATKFTIGSLSNLDFSGGSRRDWRQHAAPQLVAAQTHACAASVMSEPQDEVLEPIPSATKFTIGSLSNLDFSGGSRRDWR
jgi:hypothetical protein